MTPDIEMARAQLTQLARKDVGFNSELDPQLTPGKVRKASVLMLFGALDSVQARSDVQTVAPQLDVLLLRRSEDLSHHPGQIAFPGGGADPSDASPIATALREASEETGLDPGGVEPLGVLKPLLVPNSGNLVTPVVGWWKSPGPTRADGTETVDVYRVPVTDLLRPEARYTWVLEREGARHRGPMFQLSQRYGNAAVWGFTAMLLDSVFDALQWSVPWDPSRVLRIGP